MTVCQPFSESYGNIVDPDFFKTIHITTGHKLGLKFTRQVLTSPNIYICLYTVQVYIPTLLLSVTEFFTKMRAR
jgi:hypothetical protein